jgi:stringent starvation protein B
VTEAHDSASMTPNRPYLLRAIYDWISDNGLTPYVLVDATREGVRVPPQVVKDGQVVLNLAMRAVADLDLGNDRVSFKARFSGASHVVTFPVSAILAVYAQENGQGMMFPADDDAAPPPGEPPAAPPPDAPPAGSRNDAKPSRAAPHLRVVK